MQVESRRINLVRKIVDFIKSVLIIVGEMYARIFCALLMDAEFNDKSF